MATSLRKRVVKYSGGIRTAVRKEGSAEAVMRKSRSLWEAKLARFTTPHTRVTLDGGWMWEMHVGIDAYLIGPLSPFCDFDAPLPKCIKCAGGAPSDVRTRRNGRGPADPANAAAPWLRQLLDAPGIRPCVPRSG